MRLIKLLAVLILLFLSANSIYPEVAKAFPELLNPDGVFVDGNQLIIKQDLSVYIYSLKDFSLVKKFGREGEGPREFKNAIEWIGFLKDSFYVTSRGKISYFTRNGDFIKEIRAVSNVGWGFEPFGKQFLGIGYAKDNNTFYQTINIYDSQLKKLKEVYRKEHDYQEGKGLKLFTSPQNMVAYDKKIFIAFSNDFLIEVFNDQAGKLFSIKREYEKLKVEDRHKKEILNHYKTNPQTKERYEWYKKNVKFPDYFPAIRYLYFGDGLIYIRTFEKVDEKCEAFVYDTKGKFVKKVFLPVYESNIMEYYSVSINKGKLYQLIENEDTEVWELHITEIR